MMQDRIGALFPVAAAAALLAALAAVSTHSANTCAGYALGRGERTTDALLRRRRGALERIERLRSPERLFAAAQQLNLRDPESLDILRAEDVLLARRYRDTHDGAFAEAGR